MDSDAHDTKPPPITEAFVRKRAEAITDTDIQKVSESEEELRKRFEKPGPIGRFVGDLKLLFSMVKDYSKGAYRQAPYWTIGAVTFTFLYILNPMDIMPDIIPGVGQLDDAAVVGICLKLIQHELSRYKVWKQDHDGE